MFSRLGGRRTGPFLGDLPAHEQESVPADLRSPVRQVRYRRVRAKRDVRERRDDRQGVGRVPWAAAIINRHDGGSSDLWRERGIRLEKMERYRIARK